MKRRYLAYGGVIALLVLVNLGRWWLHGGAGDSRAQTPVLAAQDFRLRANVPTPAEVRRNLFAPQALAAQTPAGAARPARAAAPAALAKPTPAPAPADAPPSQAQLAAAGLGRLRLLGVVFRAGQGQAYLALDQTKVMAGGGETVFGQFIVDKVTVDAVELRDPRNNTTRRIPVSGK